MGIRGNLFPFAESSPIVDLAVTAGRFTTFTFEFFRNLLLPPYRLRSFFKQGTQIGIMSVPVASLTALFTGMVMVLQIGVELSRFGASTYTAGLTARALSREMIPVFTAIVVGARISASMAAELGTMRVTEQIDAMAALSVRPVHYLVVPRVFMSILMLPVISVYAGFIGFVGGLVVGVQVLNIPASAFVSTTLSWLTPTDILSGLGKTFVFGFFAGMSGCYYGFQTKGGAEGVGRSTTSSVVFTIIVVLASDFILTTWIIYFQDIL